MLWQEFPELKKNGESMIEFLNKVDNIVFKLQSEDEKISNKMKISIVFKALPQKKRLIQSCNTVPADIVSTIERATD